MMEKVKELGEIEMRRVLVAIATVGVVAGCGGEPEPVHQGSASSMEVNRRGAEVYGTAGAGWTNEELRAGLNAGTVCNNNERVQNLEITRDASGRIRFTGVCAR
ncbi:MULTISPECIES: hypothetical protein [unclassified Roseovarius]|uniref:hypothetical protein n=1 Tax=unclassified Roseovarius TaxID=2614913 RepID=UPI00273FD7E4|nr:MULTISPECIES: hypothetical protein [unclassified Roseovarius]